MFMKSEFSDFKVFRPPLGPMRPIGTHWTHGAHGDLWTRGLAATHPPRTETGTATRAVLIANAPRDRIRRARRFTSLTPISSYISYL